MLIPPVYRDCVCFVYATFGGASKPVGTAFFLSYETPPIRWIVVVTALHVVANAQRDSDDHKTYLRVNTRDGGFRLVEVAAEKWFKPDMSEEIIDIAFCQWDELPGSSDFDFLCIGTELAATQDVVALEQIGVGNEVAFAGLFVNHHGKQRNEPVVRFGNICAVPTEPVSTRVGPIQAYLVESRSVGGLSGSPVMVDVGPFVQVENRREYRRDDRPVLYLLGVMNAHWNAPVEAGKVSGDLSTEYVNMGIAVVTPIDKVMRVIEQSPYGQMIRAMTQKLIETEVPPGFAPIDPAGRRQVMVVKMDMKTGQIISGPTMTDVPGPTDPKEIDGPTE